MTEIKITSPQSAENVLKCRDALEVAVEKARKQAMPTHFVSVPVGLTSVKIREQYQNFVHSIRADEDLPEDCKNPDLFITPSKLHLTLCVLRLFTEEDVNSAKQFLDDLFQSEAIKNFLQILTLNIFNLNLMNLNILLIDLQTRLLFFFAKCVSERLQKLANIVEESLSASFLTEKRKSKEVVLHMTMMNTKYLREKKRSFLNVSKLLEKFGKLNFDPVNVTELHLCEMSSLTDAELALETYKCIHQLQFPTK
uniref:A-kinase anchor protein 7-like phosphoesterase domain-containing protein n=1 Tax=Meloidogyne incognita TaxID=6306 RepID=A0A914NVV4_MELIC